MLCHPRFTEIRRVIAAIGEPATAVLATLPTTALSCAEMLVEEREAAHAIKAETMEVETVEEEALEADGLVETKMIAFAILPTNQI